MASSVSLCVGCGKDQTDCSKTRKKLGDDSKASDQATRISVLSAWRELAANTTNLQECSSVDGSQLKMCSSCFNDYDKLVKLKKKNHFQHYSSCREAGGSGLLNNVYLIPAAK